MENISSEKFACAIARFLDDNKAKDIVILNVANVSSLSDYFIIATGSSTPHIRALTENIRKKIKDIFKRLPLGEESERLSKWNLLDYGEVVIHIMNQEQRDIYKIEKFWSHALTVEQEKWEELSKEFTQYE
ncbi:MAG: ribosome silencing factor [Candidatus Gastranaerophilales bacterium]|nr:ribosome silencing factor [Candidatus Gastranaerophilales bacterium]